MQKIFGKIAVVFIGFFLLPAAVLFAGIMYDGDEYTERDMDFSIDGKGEYYYVVSGTVSSVNSWSAKTITINGEDYTNTWSSTMPEPVDEKKYFIYYKGNSPHAHFEIAGENDWSSPDPNDTTAITLPFSKTGAGRFTFSTEDKIASVVSSDMDTLLINEVDYTNQTSTSMPAKIGGNYYIYYSASLESAELALEKGVDTTAVTMPYEYDGPGEFYLKTNGTITSIGSNNTESVTINGENYTNSWSSTMPDRIDGYYYIYYRASVDWAHLEIDGDNTPFAEADTINITMPYRYDGTGKHYFATSGTISEILSSSTDSVSINGVDYTNISSSAMPPRIDGWYYVYYNASKTWAYLELEGDTIPVVENDTIKIDVMPFEYTGQGKHYFWTDGTITSIQSNGTDSVFINGMDITNIYTENVPDRINGRYYIHYNSSNTYAALTVEGDTTSVAPPDTTEITLPFTHTGPDERYFAISDNVAFMNSWGMDVLTVNNEDFTNATNVTESMLPPRVNGYYYVYYRSNKSWAEFSVTGSVKLYVDANPADGEWADKDYYTGLSEAISDAVSGQEIWVAAGTYYPGDLREDSFMLKTGVKIYGGFKGGESTLGQRDVWGNPAVLSGEIGVNGDNSDNSYHVVSASGNMTTANTVLDGFVIRGGYADNGSGGAGLLLQNGASPLITHCIFSNNVSTGNGGAVALSGNDTEPVFEYCLFHDNEAVSGAATYIPSLAGNIRTVSIGNSTFAANTASVSGGAVYAGEDATVMIDSTVFWNNTAAGASQSIALNTGSSTASFSAADDTGLQGTAENMIYYSTADENGPFMDLVDYIVDSEYGVMVEYGYRNGIYKPLLNIKIYLEGAF